MARSDLVVSLARAGSRNDRVLFRQTLEAIIAEERAKQHHVLARRLAEVLNTDGALETRKPPGQDDPPHDLVFTMTPRRTLDELILPDAVRQACRELIEEHHRRDLLRSHGLEPRNRVLLVGPPGNGKTTLAEALAEALMLPFIVVRYEGIIGSYLGETAVRLRRLFDYVRSRHCLLFLDEFDTLGKERGDTHDTGEIKRVVSSLLLQLDDLPSHVLTVTATNHPELLDRAVWRRFQLRLELPPPGPKELELWFDRFKTALREPIRYSAGGLAQKFRGVSYSEVEDFCGNIMRRRVLELPDARINRIIGHELKQWQARYTPDHPKPRRSSAR